MNSLRRSSALAKSLWLQMGLNFAFGAYRSTLKVAGRSRALRMDISRLTKVADRWTLDSDGALGFALPPGEKAYLVELGNTADFTKRPAKLAFRVSQGVEIEIRIASSEAWFDNSCSLCVLFYSETKQLEYTSIDLSPKRITRRLLPPSGANAVSLAFRLAGSGVLRPLQISVVEIGRDMCVYPFSSDTDAPFDRMVTEAQLPSSSIACVCHFEDMTLASRSILLRPDQDFPESTNPPLAGYVFNDCLPPFWGWYGCLEENHYATMALKRQVAAANALNLPSVLIYDQRTSRKPFYDDISTEFTHRLRLCENVERRIAALLDGVGG